MKRLTLKQSKFIKKYIQTGNGSQSAMQAYDVTDPEVAKSIASENLTKPYIKKTIDEALAKAGLNDESFADQLTGIAVATPDRPLSYSEKLKALELYARVTGKLNKTTTSLTVSLSQRLEAKPFKELKTDLALQQQASSKLLEDLG